MNKLATSLESIRDHLLDAVPENVEVLFGTADHRDSSWVLIEVTKAPSTIDALGERNRLYTADLELVIRGVVEGEEDRAYLLTASLSEQIVRSLRNFYPRGSENLIQEDAGGIEAQGTDADKRWYQTTLTYTLTLLLDD